GHGASAGQALTRTRGGRYTRPMRRVARFFFMHIGSFVAVIVYFNVAERGGYTPDGVRHALTVALGAMSAYVALAWSQDEMKQFDVSLWTMFAVGTVASRVGVASVLWLFQHYSGT